VKIARHHSTLEIVVDANRISPFEVLQKLRGLGTVLTFEVRRGSLEDAFIELLSRRKAGRETGA
jgi:hypothetical protein